MSLDLQKWEDIPSSYGNMTIKPLKQQETINH